MIATVLDVGGHGVARPERVRRPTADTHRRYIAKTDSRCQFFVIYLCYLTSNTEAIAVTRRS